jgi:hypothetical protein
MARLGLIGLLGLAGCAGLGEGAAAALPEIRISERNRVPSCVTPERLMQFVRRRNSSLDPKLRAIAEEYRRHGERWRVRWDYAFFQAMVETNYLSFRAPGGSMGDVHPRQNNFAGIGATGGGVPGDSYPDVSTGVLAQIQHLVVYSGERLPSPVAPRTRLKMDEILGKSAALGRPVTFADLSRRWAVDPRYGSSIEFTARSYRSAYCSGRGDEIVGDSRRVPKRLAQRSMKDEVEDEEPKRLGKPMTRSEERPGRSASLERGRRPPPSVEDERPRAPVRRSEPPKRAEPPARTATAPPAPPPPAAKAPAAPAAPAAPRPSTTGALPAKPPGPTPAPAQGFACKVFTASYGGPKSVLIQAQKDSVVNYTVLEVVVGKEQDQARAFIAAYAQGGKSVGEFATREEALKKAFELCPKE